MKTNRLRTVCIFAATGIMLFSLLSCADKAGAPLIPSDYSAWKRTTDIPLDYPIPGHMNNYRKIFINDIGLSVDISTVNGRRAHDYPDGTIILKEVYEGQIITSSDKPVMLTVMVKDRNNQKARGGWLWIVKDLSSNKEDIITQEFCITCHGNANEPHPYGDGNLNNEFRDFAFFPVK